MKSSRLRLGPSLATSLCGAMLLAACGGGAGADPSQGGAAGSAGLSAGATKEQYARAFTTLEPITLRLQAPTAKGSAVAAPSEAYAAALEEWSGGKITVEMYYAGSVATVDKMSAALSDGLVDIGMHLPVLEGSQFPVLAFASNLTKLHSGTPIGGSIQLTSMWADLGTRADVRAELEKNGIHPLLPILPSSSSSLLCATDSVTTLADVKGKVIRPSSAANAGEITALGGKVANIPSTETFEALQRGAIDCTIGGIAFAVGNGLMDVIQHWTLDPRAQFNASFNSFDMSKESWDALPLVAKQLLTDRLDVYIAHQLDDLMFSGFVTGLNQAHEKKVNFHAASPDLIGAMADYQKKALTEASSSKANGTDPAEFAAAAEDAATKWAGVVRSLGYDESTAWPQLPSFMAASKVDVAPAVKAIVEQLIVPNRPN